VYLSGGVVCIWTHYHIT